MDISSPLGLRALSLFVFLSSLRPVLSFIADFSTVRINCGGEAILANGLEWGSDKYFEGGDEFKVSGNLTSTGASLRAFSSTSKSCYNVPVVRGRFAVSLGFYYGNYDGHNFPPLFIVSIGDVVVADTSIKLFESYATSLSFIEFFPFFDEPTGTMKICLTPLRGWPIINSIEITSIDTDAYLGTEGFVLTTLKRLNFGGPAITGAPSDAYGRQWQTGNDALINKFTLVNTSLNISGSNVSPDFIPEEVLSTAVQANSTILQLHLESSPLNLYNDWLIRFHFCELYKNATNTSRKFLLGISVGSLSRAIYINIVAETSQIRKTTKRDFVVRRSPTYYWPSILISMFGENSTLPPIINGLEVLEMIPLTSNFKNYKDGPSTSRIVVIIIGCITGLVLIFLVILIILIVRKRRQIRGVAQNHNAAITQDNDLPPPVQVNQGLFDRIRPGSAMGYQKSTSGAFHSNEI